MATPKDITVTDIEQGRLYITPPDAEGNMMVQRDYRLVGNDQPFFASLNDQVLTRNVVFASLPQSMRDALITMNGWTYAESLIDLGMEDT
jgi:hypothetical protein